MSASKIQKEPQGQGKIKTKFHWLGQTNSYGQKYITRNCFFEPSCEGTVLGVERCISEVELSFKYNKPAIISSHRLNYISSLNENNRKKSISELDRLLKIILVKWPEVEFLTSSELGSLISNS